MRRWRRRTLKRRSYFFIGFFFCVGVVVVFGILKAMKSAALAEDDGVHFYVLRVGMDIFVFVV
jgi:hypothetical protein